MPEKDLTLAQRSTLLTLMIKAGPLPNTFLRNIAKIGLDKPKRDQLADQKLITVTEKPLVLELTEDGWAQAIKELGADTPPRAGALGGTLYVLLNFLSDYLERNDLAASQFFVSQAAPTSAPAGPDLETRIRAAYATLAKSPGDFVMLDALRSALTSVSRADVDAVLVQLNLAPDVNLVPESNQKVLTAAERAAAVSIGNQDKHLISIGS